MVGHGFGVPEPTWGWLGPCGGGPRGLIVTKRQVKVKYKRNVTDRQVKSSRRWDMDLGSQSQYGVGWAVVGVALGALL
jgi:hypothetical protein